MTKLLLDAEPPSRFEGKKEVKGKNKNLPHLIVSLRNEKNKSKSANVGKSLEKEVVFNWQKNSFDFNYFKKEESYMENNLTLTAKEISFSKPNMTSDPAMLNFHYIGKEENVSSTDKKPQGFYSMNSPYSFMLPIKEENKKDYMPYESKEQDKKEIVYPVYNFDEKTTEETENGL